MKNVLQFLFAALFVITLASCGDGSQNAGGEQATDEVSNLSGSIKIDGSSTVYPITEAVAEEFRAVAPKVKVTVGISGTGGGFKKFGRGETDISDASRPIKDKEAKTCADNSMKYVELTVAYDGLAVLINPENDWVDIFTIEELKKLWEPSAQGVIMKWSDIREGWPEEEIHLYGPGVASGTYDYFTEAIVGKSGSSRGDFTASEDDNVLVQGIATDKYALGFFGLAYYQENKDKLSLVAVDNGTGGVVPTMETVASNEYAPLSRPIFIYVSSAAVKKIEVIEFVNFYLDNTDELVPDVGYIALPAAVMAKEIEEFKAFTTANK